MAHQAKAGNIGAGVGANPHHGFGSGAVQVGHGFHRPLQHFFRHPALLARGGDDAGAQGLGQHQHVAWTGARVGDLLAWLHQSHHRQAVLRLWVIYSVAAHDEAACFSSFGVTAPQHLAQHRLIQRGGESHDIQRQKGLAAHGIDIA